MDSRFHIFNMNCRQFASVIYHSFHRLHEVIGSLTNVFVRRCIQFSQHVFEFSETVSEPVQWRTENDDRRTNNPLRRTNDPPRRKPIEPVRRKVIELLRQIHVRSAHLFSHFLRNRREPPYITFTSIRNRSVLTQLYQKYITCIATKILVYNVVVKTNVRVMYGHRHYLYINKPFQSCARGLVIATLTMHHGIVLGDGLFVCVP